MQGFHVWIGSGLETTGEPFGSLSNSSCWSCNGLQASPNWEDATRKNNIRNRTMKRILLSLQQDKDISVRNEYWSYLSVFLLSWNGETESDWQRKWEIVMWMLWRMQNHIHEYIYSRRWCALTWVIRVFIEEEKFWVDSAYTLKVQNSNYKETIYNIYFLDTVIVI